MMTQRCRRSIVALTLATLFSLAAAVSASTVCVLPSAGCHVCYFYGSDGSYQGYISWGGCAN